MHNLNIKYTTQGQCDWYGCPFEYIVRSHCLFDCLNKLEIKDWEI